VPLQLRHFLLWLRRCTLVSQRSSAYTLSQIRNERGWQQHIQAATIRINELKDTIEPYRMNINGHANYAERRSYDVAMIAPQ